MELPPEGDNPGEMGYPYGENGQAILTKLFLLRARRQRAQATRQRLAAELREGLAAGYRAGIPVSELARAAGIRRQTAWAIIRDATREG